MKPLGFIYVTTCKTNGKIYIGKHEFSDDKHLNSHYLGSGILLRKAIKKYGKENFERKILKICFSINQLNGYETYYIRKLDARNPEVGYNLAKGGYGFRSGENNPSYGDGTKNPFYGKHHTDETKRKISEANSGKVSPNKGKRMSEEARRKMSIAAKKRMSNPENNPMYGKHHTEATKEKNRQKHIGKTYSEESRKKMSESMKKLATGRKSITNGIRNTWLHPGESMLAGFNYGFTRV